MAQLVGHLVAGRRLVSNLTPMNKMLLKNNEHFFELGVQGPDILYPSLAKDSKGTLTSVGSRMHEDNVNNSLLCMQDYALHSREHNLSLFSYIAGYVSHYHLDKNIHPYVAKRMKRDGVSHNKVETDIEGAIYNHCYGKKINSFSLYSVYNKDISFYTPVAEMYRVVMRDVFRRSFPISDILEAAKNLLTFQNLFNNPSVKVASKLFKFNKSVSAFIKNDNKKDVEEIVQIFEQTNQGAAPEVDQMLDSLKSKKPFAIDGTLGFCNGL